MDIRSRRIILFVSTLIIVMISFNNLFSQEPSKSDLMQEIRNKLEKAPRFLAYKAFKKSDTSLCDSAEHGNESGKDCWGFIKFLVFMRELVNGKCNNLPFEYRDYVDLCNAVNSQRCSSLPGYKKVMCEALINNNPRLMAEAFSDVEFPEYVTDKKDQAEYIINVYNGFKSRSASACSKFSTPNLLISASCEMLFGNSSFEKELDDISQDIFYAIKSKKSCSTCPKFCNNIKNSFIKHACQDDSVKSIDDILDVVWK